MEPTPRAPLSRWWPVLLVFVFPALCCLAGGLELFGTRGRNLQTPAARFPPALVPPGGTVRATSSREDPPCYSHELAQIDGVTPASAAAWAARAKLPCATDGGNDCAAWSTELRAEPFWHWEEREPNGLDTVDARLVGTTLQVDWGDYLCSGPN